MTFRGGLLQIGNGARSTRSPVVTALIGCHERIRFFVALALKIGVANSTSQEEIIDACDRVERYFCSAFRQHVVDEEQCVEPRLRGRSALLDRALDTMGEQHETHEPQLRALLEHVRRVRHEPQKPMPRAALARIAAELQKDFEAHLQLEETCVFPALEALDAGTQDAVIADMSALRAVR